MRFASVVALAICSMWLFSQPALADKRVALVIGNSAYQTVRPLPNPANDAEAMSAMFKSAGFDVVEFKRDLTTADMRRALRDFSDDVRDADVAVVYYADTASRSKAPTIWFRSMPFLNAISMPMTKPYRSTAS